MECDIISHYNKLSDFQYARFQILAVHLHFQSRRLQLLGFGLFSSVGITDMQWSCIMDIGTDAATTFTHQPVRNTTMYSNTPHLTFQTEYLPCTKCFKRSCYSILFDLGKPNSLLARHYQYNHLHVTTNYLNSDSFIFPNM